MSINFPNSPVDGQIYVDPVSNSRYVYEAATSRWKSIQYTATVVSYGFQAANAAFTHANSAYNQGNTSAASLSSNWAVTNTVYGVSNNAYASVNSNWSVTNALYSVANSAYASANNVGPQIAPTYNTANNAYNTTNAAYTFANSAFASINSNWTVLNAAYNVINTSFASTNSNWTVLNAAYSVANSAYGAANNITPQVAPSYNTANSAYASVNSNWTVTNALYSLANTSYDSVNSNWTVTNTVYTVANSSYGFSNSAYASINSNWTVLNVVYSVANSAYGAANNVGPQIAPTYNTANAAFNTANAAYGKANTALQNTTGTFSGSLTATGSITANSYIYVTAIDGTGNEGGEIQLNGAGTYTGWSLDAYQNNYRVFARTGTTVSNVNFFHAIGCGSIRMGVNKNDPLYTLDVNGGLYSTSLGVGTGPSGTTGEIRATNNITAYYSDGRLKTIISTIPSPLEKLNQLSGVIYINNETASLYGYNDKSEQVGVIAQQVEKVLPQIVKPAPFDIELRDGVEVSKSGENYKTVQYDKLIPLLIEAIKELKAEIDELRKR